MTVENGLLIGSLKTFGAVWLSALLGTGLAVVGVAAGWSLGRETSVAPVRLIAWWVRKVVLPLLRCRSGVRRAGVIFANNISILALLVLAGARLPSSLLVIAALGVSLGIGLRVLSDHEDVLPAAPIALNSSRPGATRRIRIGIALNLLEPPAIALAIGLSLGRTPAGLSPVEVWSAFGIWVVSLTLIAAVGESLWLGVLQTAGDDATVDQPPSPPEDQDA